ncbi:MAG: hypothetical protein ACK5RL_05810 [Acidimicrobiales bacterium]
MTTVDQHTAVHHHDAVHEVQRLLNDLGQVLQRPPEQRAHAAARVLADHNRIDAWYLTSYQLEVQEIARAALVALATGEPIRPTSIHQWAVSVVESHTAGAHDPAPTPEPDDPPVAADHTAPRPAVARRPAPERPRPAPAPTPPPSSAGETPAYGFLRATTSPSAPTPIPPDRWAPPNDRNPKPSRVFAEVGVTTPADRANAAPSPDRSDHSPTTGGPTVTPVHDPPTPVQPETPVERGSGPDDDHDNHRIPRPVVRSSQLSPQLMAGSTRSRPGRILEPEVIGHRPAPRRSQSHLWTVLGGLLAVVAGATAVAVVDSTLNRAGDPPVTIDADPAGATTTPGSSGAAPDAGGCDPNYAPCVPVVADVSCLGGGGVVVEGPITVIGTDIHGLDPDGDGTAC